VSPGKRKGGSKRKIEVNSFDRNVIKMMTEDIYVKQKMDPAVNELIGAIKEKIHFS
jgi:hypothetical protein